MLIWINVDRIDDILKSVSASGGEVIEPPSPTVRAGSRQSATRRAMCSELCSMDLAEHSRDLSIQVEPSIKSMKSRGTTYSLCCANPRQTLDRARNVDTQVISMISRIVLSFILSLTASVSGLAQNVPQIGIDSELRSGHGHAR